LQGPLPVEAGFTTDIGILKPMAACKENRRLLSVAKKIQDRCQQPNRNSDSGVFFLVVCQTER
jgi:hypothetical protein